MNGFTVKCFECKYFTLVSREEFDSQPKKFGCYRDGFCNKDFSKLRGYSKNSKPPYIIWSRQSACFQFEPAEETLIEIRW